MTDKKRVVTYLAPKDITFLEQLARNRHRSVSEYVRHVLTRHLREVDESIGSNRRATRRLRDEVAALTTQLAVDHDDILDAIDGWGALLAYLLADQRQGGFNLPPTAEGNENWRAVLLSMIAGTHTETAWLENYSIQARTHHRRPPPPDATDEE